MATRYDDLIPKKETAVKEPLFVSGFRAVLPKTAEEFIGIPPESIKFTPPSPKPPKPTRYDDLIPKKAEAQQLAVTIPLSPLATSTLPAASEETAQTFLRQAPPKTGFEKFKEVISRPFVKSLEDQVAKDQAVFALHKSLNERYYQELGKQIGIDPKEIRSRIDEISKTFGVPKEQFSSDQVRENFDSITKELGLRQIPTTEELITALFYVPITAGLLTNPISTVVGLGAFTALSEAENLVISKIRQKPYIFGQGQNVSDLLPDEVNDLTKDTVEILDFLAKAKALHVTYEKTPEVIRTFTKNVATTYNLPKTVFISGEKIKSIFQTGEKINAEELKLIQELGLTGEQYKQAIKNGVSVEVPIEKVVTITDKPYWAKFKQFLRLQPTEAEVRVTRPGVAKQVPLGLLGPAEGKEIIPTVEEAKKAPELPKIAEIPPELAPKHVPEARKEVGVPKTPPAEEKPAELTLKTKAPALKRVMPDGYTLTSDSWGNDFVQIKGEIPENIKSKVPSKRGGEKISVTVEKLAQEPSKSAKPVQEGRQENLPKVQLVRFQAEDGTSLHINKEYLNLALRQYPKAEFLLSKPDAPLALIQNGEIVATIAPIKDVKIQGVPEIIPEVKPSRYEDLIPEEKRKKAVKRLEEMKEKAKPFSAKAVKEVAKKPAIEEAEEPTEEQKEEFKKQMMKLGYSEQEIENIAKIAESDVPFDVVEAPTAEETAGVGVFREGEPIKLGNVDKIRPIEFPELVEIAQELQLTTAVVKKFRKPGRLGVFRGEKGIALSADLFKKGNEVQLARALAHEIGHLIDYLPEGTLKRGNLLGRLESLIKFRNAVFTTEDGKEIINKEIRKELLEVSRFWRPPVKFSIDPETGKIVSKEVVFEDLSKSFQAYRNSGKELYADAISMLFNNPGLLEQMAPKFYSEFFEALDKKPDVKEAYFGLQEALSGTREELVERRRAGVRRMFEEGDYKALELQKQKELEREQAKKDLVFRLKVQLIDKNFPLIDRVKQLEKAGTVIPEDENPIYFLEERNYVGGVVKAYTEQNFEPAYRTTQEAGIDWTEFGEALLYERILAGDRSELANPKGITPAVAEELYSDLKKKLGPEKTAILQEQIKSFREAVKKVADEAYKAGLYTEELYKQMQENPAYVTFQVIEHLEDGVTSRVYKQIGTLKEITNPADATIMKTLVTIRATEYNKMKDATFKFLTERFPDQIEDAKEVFTGKGRKPVELPKSEKGRRMITYYKEGKLKGKYVDTYIADSIENASVGQNWAVVQVLKGMNSKLFRPLFITFNLGFQSFNLLRDFFRFWKNTPDMTVLKAIKRYRQAAPAAKIRAFGLPDNPTPEDLEAQKLIQEAEAAKILSVTFNDVVLGRGVPGDTQIEDILSRVGVGGFEMKQTSPLAKPFVAVLEFIKDMGDLVESLPKLAGIYEFKGKGNVADISPAQRSFIRRKIGSPDFLAGGTYKPITNEVALFSNAIVQAIRSDVEVATEPSTRSGYWWKTAKMNLVPKVLMFAAMLGLFGPAVKKIMEGASEYDKTNYTIIPLGEDENGNPAYFRLPQDDAGRFISGIFWKALRVFKGDADVVKSLTQVLDYTAGQLPSVAPPIEAAISAYQFVAGQNPYDFFRARNVLTDDEFKARDLRTAKKFLGWEFQQLGGGIVWKFYAGEQTPRKQSVGQTILQLPIISNVIGRFIKISNYGQVEQLREEIGTVEQKEARRRLDERDAVNQAVRAYQDFNPDEQNPATVRQMAKDISDEIYRESPLGEKAEKRKRIEKKIRLGLVKGESDPVLDALFSATSNDQKIQVLLKASGDMKPQEFDKFLMEAVKEDVISSEVRAKVKKQLK